MSLDPRIHLLGLPPRPTTRVHHQLDSGFTVCAAASKVHHQDPPPGPAYQAHLLGPPPGPASGVHHQGPPPGPASWVHLQGLPPGPTSWSITRAHLPGSPPGPTSRTRLLGSPPAQLGFHSLCSRPLLDPWIRLPGPARLWFHSLCYCCDGDPHHVTIAAPVAAAANTIRFHPEQGILLLSPGQNFCFWTAKTEERKKERKTENLCHG